MKTQSTWSWADVKPAKPEPAAKPTSTAVRITLASAEVEQLDGIAAAAECSRAEMVRRLIVAAVNPPIAPPVIVEPVAVLEKPIPSPVSAPAVPEPIVQPSPAPIAGSSSRIAEQGRTLMSLLRRAPREHDGSALFVTAVIAKRLTTTELRLQQILEHLEEIDELEFRQCTLKGHFRVAVSTPSEAS